MVFLIDYLFSTRDDFAPSRELRDAWRYFHLLLPEGGGVIYSELMTTRTMANSSAISRTEKID